MLTPSGGALWALGAVALLTGAARGSRAKPMSRLPRDPQTWTREQIKMLWHEFDKWEPSMGEGWERTFPVSLSPRVPEAIREVFHQGQINHLVYQAILRAVSLACDDVWDSSWEDLDIRFPRGEVSVFVPSTSFTESTLWNIWEDWEQLTSKAISGRHVLTDGDLITEIKEAEMALNLRDAVFAAVEQAIPKISQELTTMAYWGPWVWRKETGKLQAVEAIDPGFRLYDQP